jgi:hypothetical protein
MANRYTAAPVPPKDILEKMYFDEFMTQTEIAERFNCSQKMVFGWFGKLGIKSRIPYKRNQIGPKNHSWVGDKATYAALHYRVYSIRGKATHCEVCGNDEPGRRYEWANVSGDYTDVMGYTQMCCSCHKTHDHIGQNFRKKRVNIRKQIDGKQQ